MRTATFFAIAALASLTIRCSGGAPSSISHPNLDGGGGTGGGVPDAGVPDAGVPDAGVPDAGVPDAGGPDGGGTDAGATDHGAPTAVLASHSADATLGVPVILDASGSLDPDGRALTFSWTVTSAPSGGEPVLDGADTAMPSFTATTEGAYVLTVRVTASDGQSAEAALSLFAHHPLRDGETFIELLSDPGDYVGGGSAYGYTQANARIAVEATGGHLTVAIDGDELWRADLQMPSAFDRIEPGTYDGLRRYPFHDPARGGLDWGGNGRGCNVLTGSFTVDSVTYTDGTLNAIAFSFEQHCENWIPALHGRIRWSAADPTRPPGPSSPPPGLWQAPAGATPASGNYVFLQSDRDDYVGFGRTYTHTQVDSVLSVSATENRLSIKVNGDDTWSGFFVGMYSISQLQVGYYGPLTSAPNGARGFVAWMGDGRGCGSLTGWFVVDNVTYSGDALTAIDLRFEQHCRGEVPALHGQIHWDASDTTQPPGPVQPPPALWRAPADATPAAGNYIYLESDPGDFIGQGEVAMYTQADSIISSFSSGNHLTLTIRGDQDWSGDFQGMSSVAQLEPGYYGNLRRYPFNNPARGGLDWSGEGRDCNTLSGWFVVDSATYSAGALTAIDLRFEQHCDEFIPALRGQIHWDSSDTTRPPGPVQPPPPDLWRPPSGSTPAAGNYVYLQSDPGDFVGAGGTYTFTPDNATVSVAGTGADVSVSAISAQHRFGGSFEGMISITQIQPGYYPHLQRYPFHNPARGGLGWSGDFRGCNRLIGWVVVDAVTYTGTAITALDLRFEQHCEWQIPALRGQVHWTDAGP